MKKLKILFITKDYSQYIFRNQYYLSTELSKITDLVLWHQSWNIHDILRKIRFKPDFILMNDISHSPIITGLSHVDIPKGIIMYDIHRNIEERKQFISQNDLHYVFSVCRDLFFRYYPEYSTRFRWLPHFINPDIFKDYSQPKTINMLMMGVLSKKYYPFRTNMKQFLEGKQGFVYHKHPGHRFVNESEKNIWVGKRYATELNRAKIFLTCDSIYHIPLLKYYEALACRTLLLAPASEELLDLGFIPGVHFVSITDKDYYKKADYLLKTEKLRSKIATQGYQMVHKLHTSNVRAAQLAKMIEKIVL
jgi:hypothetical protein